MEEGIDLVAVMDEGIGWVQIGKGLCWGCVGIS